MVTVPAVFLFWVIALLLSPIAFLTALVVDAVRATRGIPPTAWRLLAYLLTYLTAEVVAMGVCLVMWIGSGFGLMRSALVDWTARLQMIWADVLWRSAMAIFRLRMSVAGEHLAAPGPVVVLSRHASIVDNILPFQLFTRRHGIRLRYVLKRELLIDPSIDIAGNWLPNHFVDRGGSDSDRELEALRRLARGLKSNEGVVIFPEGTRFTSDKQRRSFDVLKRRNPRFYELSRGLRHLLPPRPGGALTMIEEAQADVVVVAHHGLDGFASVANIWRGGMVGKHVQVLLSRYRYEDIPAGRGPRTEWLFKLWQDMDDWLAQRGPVAVVGDA
jgi:1-acyl-sn-glycerol-3-phosphate acyltransferase